ncbi:MAG TPA: alpha/beta hydrolase-fold protein [Rhodanobacteraceae bacterium]
MKIYWTAALLAVMLAPPALAKTATEAIPVTLAPTIASPQSGRIIVFAKKVDPAAKPPNHVDTSAFEPTGTAIAAKETWSLRQGETAEIDGDVDTYPVPFAKLPPGTYAFQAVLDRNHDYAYGGRGSGDIVSPVVEAKLPGPIPTLTLTHIVKWNWLKGRIAHLPEAKRIAMKSALSKLKRIDFVSPLLSAFWGRPMHIRAWIALPPGYGAPGKTFPIVYTTNGFGGPPGYQKFSTAQIEHMMTSGAMPPMIWVYLDEASPRGTNEFADSVNNGPWGQALTTEFIPWIDKHYATDGKPASRFLTAHSSGGWAVLWLQVRYPKVFGGSWPISPDPVDFHDFVNIDIYAPHANAYHDAGGKPIPLMRDHGKVIATTKQFARMERVLGVYGGQFASFDWVFSPKGADGRPEPLFNRATGAIDPKVADYWRKHYDIAWRIRHDWPTLKPDLDGKIHLYVGTADNFYLDGSARLLKKVFDSVGAHEDFNFVPNKTHFDIYKIGDQRFGLMKKIAWDMYKQARPGTKRPTKNH